MIQELGNKLSRDPIVVNAYEIAKKAHRQQERKKTGLPYIIHPLRVTVSLLEALEATPISDPDLAIIQAIALLHDVIEDTTVGVEEFNIFNDIMPGATKKITDGVLGLTNDKSMEGSRKERKEAMNQRIQGSPPIVKLIKAADRLDNVLDFLETDMGFLRKKYGKESRNLIRAIEKNLPTDTWITEVIHTFTDKIRKILDEKVYSQT